MRMNRPEIQRPRMQDLKKPLLNNTFFNFLFGFVFILSMSLGVVLVVNYIDLTFDDVKQTAVALLAWWQ